MDLFPIILEPEKSKIKADLIEVHFLIIEGTFLCPHMMKGTGLLFGAPFMKV